MKTIQEMVQKATGATGTLLTCSLVGIKEISYFAALVREDAIAEANAKANASWTLALEALEQWHFGCGAGSASHDKALTAIKEALAQPQQESVAREPNDAELLKAFTRSNNGPNPFYRCNTCGDTEPGVREYLSNHWLKHNNTSPPPCQTCEALARTVMMDQTGRDV